MPLATRKVRRIVIEEDRLGDWRIRLFFTRGRQVLLRGAYDTHGNACMAASGVSLVHTYADDYDKTKVESRGGR